MRAASESVIHSFMSTALPSAASHSRSAIKRSRCPQYPRPKVSRRYWRPSSGLLLAVRVSRMAKRR
jgi:hypothetical protein